MNYLLKDKKFENLINILSINKIIFPHCNKLKIILNIINIIKNSEII